MNTRQFGPRARIGATIGKPGGVTGNTRTALSLLLAVVSQATGMEVAARAQVGPTNGQGVRETLEVRRARVTDGLPAREAAATFVVVCNGEDTMRGTFDDVRELLAGLTLLDRARWTLVDLKSEASGTQVADGR